MLNDRSGELTPGRRIRIDGSKNEDSVKSSARAKDEDWQRVETRYPGESRGFKATLVKRIDVNGEIIAIFRVLPNPEKRT